MKTNLRVGLIGLGRIAQLVHLRVLSRLPGVQLVAVAEQDPERLRAAQALTPQPEAFTDYRELLSWSRVDAVVICLPTGMHANAAAAAFVAGKHVYLEKPLATTREEAEVVLEEWRASDRVGMIGFNLRRHPFFQRLRQDLAAGRLGRVAGARSVFCAAVRELPAWKRERHSGGGALLDLGSHHADLARYVFRQEVREVSAMIRSVSTEEDTATVEMRLDGGLLVQSLFSMAAAEENRFEVYGDRGVLTVDTYRGRRLESTPFRAAYSGRDRLCRAAGLLSRFPGDFWAAIRRFWEPTFRPALEAFTVAARNGTRAEPDLLEGYRSLAIVLAAEESARTGQPVVPTGLPRTAALVP